MKRKYTKYIMLKTVEKSPFYGTLWQGGLSGFSVPPGYAQKLKNFLSFIFSFFYVRNNTPVRSEYNMLTRKYKTNKLTSYYVRKDTPVRMIENVMIHHYVQREQVNMLRFFNLTGTSCFHYDKETTTFNETCYLLGLSTLPLLDTHHLRT